MSGTNDISNTKDIKDIKDMKDINDTKDISEKISAMKKAKELSFRYMENADSMRAFPSDQAIAALDNLDGPLPEDGMPAEEVLEMLDKYAAPATTGVTGGRYFGLVVGNVLPAAQGAEWLMNTWNQNASLYLASPAASKTESIAEKWLVELMGFPKGTAMGTVTGSTNALLCAMTAARNYLLEKQGYDIHAKGFRGAPNIRLVMSEEVHSAVKSSLSVIGFGTEEAELIPCDDFGRVIPEEMPELDDTCLVILQAGNVNGGAFDPIGEICEKANAAGAWVHVDGAFGLWACASPAQRVSVPGIENADSWSCDAHKTLNSGYDCGLVFCKRPKALATALTAGAPYIEFSEHRDGMMYATEMSRRAYGFVLWSIVKSLGARGIAKMIDDMCDNAQYLGAKLKEAGIPLVNPPIFNQMMIQFSSDEETNAVLAAIQKSGTIWCGSSVFKGRTVIRISISSYSSTREDMDAAALVIKEAAASVCG